MSEQNTYDTKQNNNDINKRLLAVTDMPSADNVKGVFMLINITIEVVVPIIKLSKKFDQFEIENPGVIICSVIRQYIHERIVQFEMHLHHKIVTRARQIDNEQQKISNTHKFSWVLKLAYVTLRHK